MKARFFFPAAFFMVLLAFSCGRPVPSVPAVSGPLVVQEAPSDASTFSFGFPLASASLHLVSLRPLDRPFPVSVALSGSSVEFLYGEGDLVAKVGAEAGAEAEAEAEAGTESAAPLVHPLPVLPEARRGDDVYLVESGVLTRKRAEDSGRAQDLGDSSPAAAPTVAAAAPTAVRSALDHPVVAGPVLFSDFLLVATDAPSFVAVDRFTLAPVWERPMDRPARGPLLVLQDEMMLGVLHADATYGLYSLKGEVEGNGSAEDPVDAMLSPQVEAFRAIEKKTAVLLGLDGELRFARVDPYGPRKAVEGLRPALFRLRIVEEGPYRLYLDGAEGKPYLVAVFEQDGSFRLSNIDYMGAESVVETVFLQGDYFVSASFLGESDASRPPARLVVARRR